MTFMPELEYVVVDDLCNKTAATCHIADETADDDRIVSLWHSLQACIYLIY